MEKRFQGVFIALLTPFIGEDVSEARLKDNIRVYNDAGLSGYVVLGSTGECVSLTDDESERLVEAARDAAGQKAKLIVGTARESTKLTIEFTTRMAGHGIDAALVRPPSYFKSKIHREALKNHYLAIADRSPVPLIIYNIPQNTGVSLDPQLIVELAGHPNIAGLKESSASLTMLAEVVGQVPPDFSYLSGSGSVFLPSLVMGASGAILAVANIAPAICGSIYRLFREGKIREAAELQLGLAPLNKTATETYGVPGLKYALDMLGLYGGPARSPLPPLDEKGRAEIGELLKKMRLVP
jgi:4-hydroxy-2-oxoglutarate aldolase